MQLASDFISGFGVGSAPRRQIITLTASNPALAIPSWAQGGKGILKISGCAAGGGGGGGNATNYVGGNGSAGAWALGAVLLIPAGASTVNAVIGAPGSGGALNTNGTAGGHTEVSFNGDTFARFRMGGGAGGGGATGSANGNGSNGVTSIVAIGDGSAPPVWLSPSGGSNAANGIAIAQGLSVMAGYPFGAGGPGVVASGSGGIYLSSTPYGTLDLGYGGGGKGGAVGSVGGNGGPGILILEFVEAL